MKNYLKDKPQFYSIDPTDKELQNTSITYNETGVTYNEAGEYYEGIYGTDGPKPKQVDF